MVLLLYTYFQNHIYATQFPYHGGSYSDRNLYQCPLQAWALATVGIYGVFIGITNKTLHNFAIIPSHTEYFRSFQHCTFVVSS